MSDICKKCMVCDSQEHRNKCAVRAEFMKLRSHLSQAREELARVEGCLKRSEPHIWNEVGLRRKAEKQEVIRTACLRGMTTRAEQAESALEAARAELRKSQEQRRTAERAYGEEKMRADQAKAEADALKTNAQAEWAKRNDAERRASEYKADAEKARREAEDKEDRIEALIERLNQHDTHWRAVAQELGGIACGGVDCDPKERDSTAEAICRRIRLIRRQRGVWEKMYDSLRKRLDNDAHVTALRCLITRLRAECMVHAGLSYDEKYCEDVCDTDRCPIRDAARKL